MVEQFDTLVITIKAKRHGFAMAFMLVWMVGWAIGLVSATNALLSGATGGASLFLLVWLTGWTLGGVFAAGALMWLFAGQETITLSPGFVTVARSIPVWTRTTQCDASVVTNLRIVETDTSFLNNSNSLQIGMFTGMSKGTFKFDYGNHTIGFGLELEHGEAQRMLSLIKERFPALIGQRQSA